MLITNCRSVYFANLGIKIMKDKENSEKSNSKESISLIIKHKIITKNEALQKTLKNFFSNIVNKLGTENVPDGESNLFNIDDPIL